jgi:hypothetical protein
VIQYNISDIVFDLEQLPMYENLLITIVYNTIHFCGILSSHSRASRGLRSLLAYIRRCLVQ